MGYTKGEWKVSQDNNGNIFVDAPMTCVARIPSTHKTGEVEANAQLISAAPELYEALQELFSQLKATPAHFTDEQTRKRLIPSVEAVRAIKRALAKMENKQ